MTCEMQVRFWQNYKFLNSQNLKKKAAWLVAIIFINIIQLNQEITSIISPAYFLRSQNVGFRKQMFIFYSIRSDKSEDGRLKLAIHKAETSGKIYLRKTFLKKYSIISEQRNT